MPAPVAGAQVTLNYYAALCRYRLRVDPRSLISDWMKYPVPGRDGLRRALDRLMRAGHAAMHRESTEWRFSGRDCEAEEHTDDHPSSSGNVRADTRRHSSARPWPSAASTSRHKQPPLVPEYRHITGTQKGLHDDTRCLYEHQFIFVNQKPYSRRMT